MGQVSRVSELLAEFCTAGTLADRELVELATHAERAAVEAAFAERDLRAVLAMTSAELVACGFTDLQAGRVRALASLVQRAAAEPLKRGESMRGAVDVFRHFHARLRELKVEQFIAVLLDGKHRVLREVLVSQGTLTSSPVHPREVFATAIRESAAAVVLVHNHPSGDPQPSADDLEVTRRLCEVGTLVGIRVVDHVIVGDGQYVSLSDRGLLR